MKEMVYLHSCLLTRVHRWVDQQILWFDIAVDYVIVMTPCNCFDQLKDVMLHLQVELYQ